MGALQLRVISPVPVSNPVKSVMALGWTLRFPMPAKTLNFVEVKTEHSDGLRSEESL
jgi:hypothetical protein